MNNIGIEIQQWVVNNHNDVLGGLLGFVFVFFILDFFWKLRVQSRLNELEKKK